MENEFAAQASEPSVKASETASLPIGELKDKTKGKMPRSRVAFSREMSMRSKESLIDMYRNQSQRAFHGNTFVSKDVIPDNMAIMWARTACRGRDYNRELTHLMVNHGWEPVPADMLPQYAFLGSHGDINDSTDTVTLPDMVLLWRDKEINDAQLESHQRNTNRNRQLGDKLKREDGLNPFAIANSEFFPTDPVSGAFSNSFMS